MLVGKFPTKGRIKYGGPQYHVRRFHRTKEALVVHGTGYLCGRAIISRDYHSLWLCPTCGLLVYAYDVENDSGSVVGRAIRICCTRRASAQKSGL